MNINVHVDPKFISEIRTALKGTAAHSQNDLELIKAALTLYGWAVKEAASGRVILSTAEDGTLPAHVTMPALTSTI